MIKFFTLFIFLVFFSCKTEEEKIVGLYSINAFVIGKDSDIHEGTYEFEKNKILIVKIDKKVYKHKWIIVNDSLQIDNLKFDYSFLNNKLILNHKSKKEGYIELIRID